MQSTPQTDVECAKAQLQVEVKRSLLRKCFADFSEKEALAWLPKKFAYYSTGEGVSLSAVFFSDYRCKHETRTRKTLGSAELLFGQEEGRGFSRMKPFPR